MTLELDLPRDSLTIPLARHLAGNAMREIGVNDDCVDDIEVALTEACTNVLDHSGPGDAYQVEFTIDGPEWSIRIIDVGAGFDSSTVGSVPAGPGAESGRGIALMRALVDQVHIDTGDQAGTVVLLHKNLVYAEDSPGDKLITG